MVELNVLLSNPGLGEKLQCLATALSSKAGREHANVPGVEARIRPGTVLRTIRQVLADHPAGLRTIEVHARVGASLGRTVSKSTVKGTLAENPAFERIRRGVYRLRQGT